MKRLRLNNTVKYNSIHQRYHGSRFNGIPTIGLFPQRIGYAEFHYVHYPEYCNTKYYIK